MRERAVEVEAVEARFATWVRLMNGGPGKVDSLLAIYHNSPGLRVMWSDGSRAEGFERLETAVKEFYGSISYMNFVPQNPHFEVINADVAVSTFRHSTDVVMPGGARLPVASGQGTLVWLKDHDEDLWQIHVQQMAVNSASMN